MSNKCTKRIQSLVREVWGHKKNYLTKGKILSLRQSFPLSSSIDFLPPSSLNNILWPTIYYWDDVVKWYENPSLTSTPFPPPDSFLLRKTSGLTISVRWCIINHRTYEDPTMKIKLSFFPVVLTPFINLY